MAVVCVVDWCWLEKVEWIDATLMMKDERVLRRDFYLLEVRRERILSFEDSAHSNFCDRWEHINIHTNQPSIGACQQKLV